MREALCGVGIALGHQGEWLIELGIDAGGVQQRLVGLGVVGFQLGVFDVAARAGAAGLHGGGEVAAGFVVVVVAQASRPRPSSASAIFTLIAEQLAVFGGGLRRRRSRSARARRASLSETWRSWKSRSAMGRLEMVVVLEIVGREVLLDLRLDLGGRFAEGVAISRVLGDALAQVVEQDAQLAEIIRVGHEQVDARPIEIGRAAAARRR